MGDTTAYKVEKKEEIRALARTGEPMILIRVWATSKGGTYFHVDIPETQLDKASEILSKRAQVIDSI